MKLVCISSVYYEMRFVIFSANISHMITLKIQKNLNELKIYNSPNYYSC